MTDSLLFLTSMGVAGFAGAAVNALLSLSAPADRCRCQCRSGRHAPAPPVRTVDAHGDEAVAVGNSGHANGGS